MALSGSLFYKQETCFDFLLLSLPKVDQEADMKLNEGWKPGFQAISLPIRKHQLGNKNKQEKPFSKSNNCFWSDTNTAYGSCNLDPSQPICLNSFKFFNNWGHSW